MPIITKLKIQKHDKERISVFLDDEYAFSIGILDASSLHRGQELSKAEIVQLRHQGRANLAYLKAIRYLSRRPHSVEEVRRYLSGKDMDDDIVEVVVDRLSDRGYVDDLEFARFWVENREQFRPRGRRALAYELRQKGVSGETIDIVLNSVEEIDSAWNAVCSQISRWAGLDEWAFKQKSMGYLSRRGFPYGVCRETADRAWKSLCDEQ